jgi:hypothetical protein
VEHIAAAQPRDLHARCRGLDPGGLGILKDAREFDRDRPDYVPELVDRRPRDLVGGEMACPLELEAEQQDESAGGTDADRHRAVGKAALEELPSLVVVEEVGELLAGDRWDGEAPAEAAVSGPLSTL